MRGSAILYHLYLVVAGAGVVAEALGALRVVLGRAVLVLSGSLVELVERLGDAALSAAAGWY